MYKINIDTLHRQQTDVLELNDIGRVELRTSLPIYFDPFKINSKTGNFILVDPHTNNTVAAGIIRDVVKTVGDVLENISIKDKPRKESPHIVRKKKSALNENTQSLAPISYAGLLLVVTYCL